MNTKLMDLSLKCAVTYDCIVSTVSATQLIRESAVYVRCVFCIDLMVILCTHTHSHTSTQKQLLDHYVSYKHYL